MFRLGRRLASVKSDPSVFVCSDRSELFVDKQPTKKTRVASEWRSDCKDGVTSEDPVSVSGRAQLRARAHRGARG